jgi:hypothetical protein
MTRLCLTECSYIITHRSAIAAFPQQVSEGAEATPRLAAFTVTSPCTQDHTGHSSLRRPQRLARTVSSRIVNRLAVSAKPTAAPQRGIDGRGSILSAVLHRLAGWWGAVALIAGVAVAATLAQTSAGHAMLRKAGLFEAPESSTSLAFMQPRSLPEQLGSARATVRVSFVIHNAGGPSRDYQWSLLVAQGGQTRRVNEGAIRVASGQTAAVTRSAEIFCTRGQVQIVVNLARPAESIDAWTACRSPRS